MKRMLAGALAGTLATVPMTAVMLALHRRLPVKEQYPLPPREITDVAVSSVGGDPRRQSHMTGLSLTAHFAYGAATGALYSVLFRQARHPVLTGSAYGVAVWVASYLGWIPAARILRPANTHPARRNALMIMAHLVWGAGTGAVDSCLSDSEEHGAQER